MMETDSKNVSSANLGSKRKQRYSSLPPSGGLGRYCGDARAAITFPPPSGCVEAGVVVGVAVALGFSEAAGAAIFG